jgi:CRISPR-associated protein Csd1
MGQAIKPYLNEENPNPAYQCGRLMAVLADLQRTAQGDVGAGVVQRYYASASTTPSLVLGRLTRTSQYHLNKLDGGLAYWYENKISGIWSNLKDNIPRTLSLEDQSLFALGYYQQIANMRAKNTNNQNTKEGN